LEQNSADANYRGVCYFDRAFIQFAGLTIGKTPSFFQFYSYSTNFTSLLGGSQSDAGLNLVAYTAQFSDGWSATISVEDTVHQRAYLHDASPGGSGIPIALPGILALTPPGYLDYGAQRIPDVVGNIRVDQPWGSALLAAAYHEVRGQYLGPNLITNPKAPTANGFALTGGVKFNLPWAQGDELWLQGTFTHGATNYTGLNPFVHAAVQFLIYNGAPGPNQSVGMGRVFDGAFNQTGMALVDGWALLAAVQHYWTPSLRSSLFGHYTRLDFGGSTNAANTASGKICASMPLTGGFNSIVTGNCNFDYAVWQVGSRTIWVPVRGIGIGLGVLYTRLDQSFTGSANLAANNTRPAGVYLLRDQDVVNSMLRFQRSFFP
jgi:hypothetical protein